MTMPNFIELAKGAIVDVLLVVGVVVVVVSAIGACVWLGADR